MPITVKDGRFYVVEMAEKHEIHESQQSAIDALREKVQDVDDGEENFEITEVEVGGEGEEWTLKQMPWRDIAVQLLRGGS